MKKVLSLCCLLLILPVFCLADGISVGPKGTDRSKSRDKAVTNILILMVDGEETPLMAVASINGKAGKAVMTRLDTRIMVDIPEAGGEVPLSQVYAMGDSKSQGYLAVRTVNRLLDLNIANYVAVDTAFLPELVDSVDGVWITPAVEEDRLLGLDEDTWAIEGKDILAYIRLSLPEDEAQRSRAYEVMMQLLRQAAEQDFMSMLGIGGKLLEAMDTNLGIMAAASLGSSVQGSSNHIELFLPQPEAVVESDPLRVNVQMLQDMITEVVYE